MDALIIEDDKEIREDFAEILNEIGIFRRVVLAEDGAVAAQKIHNQMFALILLDINLPKKDGVSLLKDIKDSSQMLDRVLIISGHLNTDVLKEALKYGVKNYFVKPFDPAVLREKIESLVKK